jgi:hypothetical protein
MNILRQIVVAGLLLLTITALYLGVLWRMEQRPQIPILLGLWLLALGVEALWSLVRWLSPLRGIFGEPEQELQLVRVMERELSRSLRHRAPLVIVAVLGRRRLSRKAVMDKLRLSDIAIVGRGRHMVILMTETRLEQAEMVMERMAAQLPIRAIAMTNEQAVQAGALIGDFGGRYRAQGGTAHSPTLALMRGLQLGLFRSRTRSRHGEPAPIYILGPQAMITANTTDSTRALADFTQRVA